MSFALAKKLNMTQVFTGDGRQVPVTVLEVPSAKITQIRTKEKDGYQAVQVGVGKKMQEFRFHEGEFKVGQEVGVKNFTPGQIVQVSGLSRGRGFAGTMKRHGFHGAPASHGHDHPRAVGSIGQMFPQHVRPGMRMAGRMGGRQATERGLLVVAVDPERSLLFVKGSVPGAPAGWVKVMATGEKQPLEIMEFGKQNNKKEKQDAS